MLPPSITRRRRAATEGAPSVPLRLKLVLIVGSLRGAHSCSYGGNRDGLHTIFKRRAIRTSLASVGGVFPSGFESLPLSKIIRRAETRGGVIGFGCPSDGASVPAVAGLRREAERAIQYVLRFWSCEKCTRSNKTVVAIDGTVKCEQCADLTRLRSLNRRKASRLNDRARDR